MTTSSTRKRSNEGRDDQDGKRLKTSSGDSEMSLRGGSGGLSKAPSEPKRGVVRPPNDEEWAELVETGVMTGVDDLSNTGSNSTMPSLLEIETAEPSDRDDDRGSTYLGAQVVPIPINLSSSPSTKSTPAKSAQPSTSRPSKTSSAASPAKDTSTTTKSVTKAPPTQPTSTRRTKATAPADTTPKQVRFLLDDFDASTPFASGMESSFLAYGSSMGFTDMSEYIQYASATPNPASYLQWKEIQDRFNDPDMPVPYLGGLNNETSPVGAGSDAGGGDPGEDGSDSSSLSDPPNEGADGDGNGGRRPPSPGPPSDFTDDQEILRRWSRLENTIEQYVEECITEAMPEDVDAIENSPFAVFRYLAGDNISYEMCQSPTYSPYLFQITIWNFLLRSLFTRGSAAWGADFKNSADCPTIGQGSGLGLATDQVTAEVMFSQNQERSYQNRLKFFIFRKEACDFIYEHLVDDKSYADQVNEMCQDLLHLFTGYFKPFYAQGNAESWTELLRLTSDVITKAWDLAILMRKSDGVWDAFILKPEKPILKDCVELHPKVDLALPFGQDSILPNSKITMTVIPGLVKHEVVPDCSRGPDGSRVRTMRRLCAKVFVDLATEDIRPQEQEEEEEGEEEYSVEE